MSDRDPNDVVRLATAPNPVQAHIWQDALEAEGIQSRVVGDYLDAGLGDIPGMRAELWVHRQDLAAAEEILRRSQTESGEAAEDSPEE
jgi:Putative prokaryotic signal transducing protein